MFLENIQEKMEPPWMKFTTGTARQNFPEMRQQGLSMMMESSALLHNMVLFSFPKQQS